jgi:hypothetical protein
MRLGSLSKKEGSGKYYLSSRGPLLEIIDLMDGKNLLDDVNYWELSRGEGPIPHFDEPFDYLMPCFAFRDLGWDCRPTSIKDIIYFIKYKEKMIDRSHQKFHGEYLFDKFLFFGSSNESSFRIY